MTSPISALLHGLTRGLVMDELDAWSAESVRKAVPAQRRSADRMIDLDAGKIRRKRAS